MDDETGHLYMLRPRMAGVSDSVGIGQIVIMDKTIRYQHWPISESLVFRYPYHPEVAPCRTRLSSAS